LEAVIPVIALIDTKPVLFSKVSLEAVVGNTAATGTLRLLFRLSLYGMLLCVPLLRFGGPLFSAPWVFAPALRASVVALSAVLALRTSVVALSALRVGPACLSAPAPVLAPAPRQEQRRREAKTE
jgi:hypothetical protein